MPVQVHKYLLGIHKCICKNIFKLAKWNSDSVGVSNNIKPIFWEFEQNVVIFPLQKVCGSGYLQVLNSLSPGSHAPWTLKWQRMHCSHTSGNVRYLKASQL